MLCNYLRWDFIFGQTKGNVRWIETSSMSLLTGAVRVVSKHNFGLQHKCNDGGFANKTIELVQYWGNPSVIDFSWNLCWPVMIKCSIQHTVFEFYLLGIDKNKCFELQKIYNNNSS